MPTFGLVLTLDPAHRAAVLRWLAGDPRARVGDPVAAQIPISWQTDATDAAHALDDLTGREGVLDVQVAYADLSDLPPTSSLPRGRHHER